MNPPDAINRLCLACGLCCNGVLFRDVELQDGDDLEALQKLGLTIRPSRTASRPGSTTLPANMRLYNTQFE